jgi:hypothetical protein
MADIIFKNDKVEIVYSHEYKELEYDFYDYKKVNGKFRLEAQREYYPFNFIKIKLADIEPIEGIFLHKYYVKEDEAYWGHREGYSDYNESDMLDESPPPEFSRFIKKELLHDSDDLTEDDCNYYQSLYEIQKIGEYSLVSEEEHLNMKKEYERVKKNQDPEEWSSWPPLFLPTVRPVGYLQTVIWDKERTNSLEMLNVEKFLTISLEEVNKELRRLILAFEDHHEIARIQSFLNDRIGSYKSKFENLHRKCDDENKNSLSLELLKKFGLE